MYSAIGEAKSNGQNCYDFFEKYTEKKATYYMVYVERWLNYVANNYAHFKDMAEQLDFMSMEASYTGDTFESENLIEKKGPLEPYKVEEFEEAFE